MTAGSGGYNRSGIEQLGADIYDIPVEAALRDAGERLLAERRAAKAGEPAAVCERHLNDLYDNLRRDLNPEQRLRAVVLLLAEQVTPGSGYRWKDDK